MFNILDVTVDELVTDDFGDVRVFETGKLAAEYIAGLKAHSDHKFRPSKAPEGDPNWQEREKAKFVSGEYKVCKVLEDAGLTIPEHYLHCSKASGFNLAYTKNDAKGREDKQTTTSVVGYLETYFSDKTTATEREAYKKKHEESHLSDIVKFAFTPDEIETVYTNYDSGRDDVAESCMRHPTEDFPTLVHPVRAYGAGDLAVAYMTNEDGETTDRAIVWPEKLLYSRVYGGAKLHKLLKALGYKKSAYYDDETRQSMAGARLLLIPHEADEVKNHIVVPYIDETAYLEEDGNGFLVITDKEGQADPQEPNGHVRLYKYRSCNHCGNKKIREDNIIAVAINEYLDAENWCQSCADTKSFYCSGYELYILKNITTVVPTHTEFSWGYNSVISYSKMFIDNHLDKYAYCKHDLSRASLKSLLKEIHVDNKGTIELWSAQSVDDTWTCEKTGKRFARPVPSCLVQIGQSVSGKRRRWATWCQQAVTEFAYVLSGDAEPKTFVAIEFIEELGTSIAGTTFKDFAKIIPTFKDTQAV